MWFTVGIDEERDAEAIKAVDLLEVIKDRLDREKVNQYNEAVKLLKKCRSVLEYRDEKADIMRLPMHVASFKQILTEGTFDEDATNFPTFRTIKEKPIVRSKTPYAKFLLCLSGTE